MPRAIKYEIDADSRKFAKGAKRAAAELKKLGKTAEVVDAALDMDLKVDERGLFEAERDLREIKELADNIDVNLDVNESALYALRRRLEREKDELERIIKTDVDIDAGAALLQLRKLERQIRSIDNNINVDVGMDREHLRRFTEDNAQALSSTASSHSSVLATVLAASFASFEAQRRQMVSSLESDLNLVKSRADKIRTQLASPGGSPNDPVLNRQLRELLDREDELNARLKRSAPVIERWKNALFGKLAGANEPSGIGVMIGRTREEIEDEDGKLIGHLKDFEVRAGRIFPDLNKNFSGFTLTTGAFTRGLAAATASTGGIAGLAVAIGAVSAAIAASGPLVAAGVTATIGPIYDLLGAYDVMNKRSRKGEAVFGGLFDATPSPKVWKDVQDWARNMSSALGVGARDIELAAAGYQDLLVPKGWSSDRGTAATLTKAFLERAAAMAEFSGVETAQGIEAVQSALTGATRPLKSLGVEIDAKKIKVAMADLKKVGFYETVNAEGEKARISIAGLNDDQLKAVALLKLIEAGSTDGWNAFTGGAKGAAGAVDNLLDSTNAFLANLKTDAIEGFGGILGEILFDMGSLSEFRMDFSLADWIKENKAEIRSFFLDLAVLISKSAVTVTDFFIGFLEGFQASIPGLQAMIQMWGEIAAAASLAGGALLLTSPVTAGLGLGLIKSAGATRDMAHAASDALGAVGTFIPGAISGLEGVREQISGVAGNFEELRRADEIELRIKALLESGDTLGAVRYLDSLSDNEIEVLVRLGALDKTELDKTLDREYEVRLKATVTAANDKVQSLFSSGQVSEAINLQYAINSATSGEDPLVKLQELIGPPGGHVAPISPTMNPTGYGQVKNDLDVLTAPRTVTITPEIVSVPQPPTSGYPSGGGYPRVMPSAYATLADSGMGRAMSESGRSYKIRNGTISMADDTSEQVQVNVNLDGRLLASYLQPVIGRKRSA